MTALVSKGTGSAWKVTGGDLGRAEVFDLGKSKDSQISVELFGFKVSDPGFAQAGYALRTPLVAGSPFRRQRCRRIAVVEHYLCAMGQASNEGQGRPYGFVVQVRGDSKPSKESLLRGIKADRRQALGQSFAFEINRNKG